MPPGTRVTESIATALWGHANICTDVGKTRRDDLKLHTVRAEVGQRLGNGRNRKKGVYYLFSPGVHTPWDLA